MQHILIVDDELDTLGLYELFLKREDRKLVTINTPVRALELLRERKWDVLITDIMMPGMDGFSLIRKASREQRALGCIAVTAFGSEETMRQALDTDCFGYIHKPFDWNYINLLVDKAARASGRFRRHAVAARPVRNGSTVGGDGS